MAPHSDQDTSDDSCNVSPSARLRRELDRLYDDYFRRWGGNEENRLYMEIAEAFRPSVQSLTISAELLGSIQLLHDEVGTPSELNDLPGFVQILTSHPIVRDGVEIRLAYDALARLGSAESRLDDLLRLITWRNLSQRAEDYLYRATQLYLWGLAPESVVMCSATLEAAYQERFTDLDMFSLQITKKGSSFEAHQYESAAFASNVFSKSQRDLAGQVRNARNSVVHKHPTVDFPAKWALEVTAEILSCLFPPQSA